MDRDLVRMPMQLMLSDLNKADHIVALKYTEHFPLMKKRFYSWLTTNDVSRMEYWDVHDIDLMTPELALPLIESGSMIYWHGFGEPRPIQLSQGETAA